MRISDWSSDVCSSDLGDLHPLQEVHRDILGLLLRRLAHPDRGQGAVLEHCQMRKEVEVLEHHADLAADLRDVLHVVRQLDFVDDDLALLVLLQPVRSEERRVGKECVRTCRSRWWTYS